MVPPRITPFSMDAAATLSIGGWDEKTLFTLFGVRVCERSSRSGVCSKRGAGWHGPRFSASDYSRRGRDAYATRTARGDLGSSRQIQLGLKLTF